LTPEEQALVKKLKSRFWRLNNLYWVQDQNGTKRKFRLRWAQDELLRSLWYLNMVLKVRQIGISTFVGLLQLDRDIFTKDQTCGIIDRTKDDAKKKLAKIKYAYDHLDDPDDPATAQLGALIKQAVRLVKENTEELEFTNGSKIWCGTSLRGGTVNFLHVSELGYIASETPEKASEIAAGSFNTVHPGNVIIVESTHEGGRYGLNYQLVRQAQASGANPETALDWKFHFFAWWREPLYTLPLFGPIKILKEHADYFAELEKQCGIKLTPEQKHWYVKKAATPEVDMARQYPGTAEEALQAIRPGAIYGKEILALRQQGRIRDFVIEGHGALITSWDIGVSDYTCIWLLQPVGLDILAVDYATFHGEKPAYYAAKMLEWERHYDRKITKHYLPHDAAHVIKLAGNKSWRDMLIAAGLKDIAIVPRTPDFWVGIQHLRSLLPRFFFHATNCSKDVILPSKLILPAGLSALSGYHTVVEAVGGKITENPVHDQSSHGADALRTFAEAHSRGMLEAGLGARENRRGQFHVQTGLSRPNVVSGSREGPKFNVVRGIR
jgi:hypothetical protein